MPDPQEQPRPDADPPLTFEQAVAQLEQIIDGIESGEVGLEQSLRQYERGVELLKHCRAVLDRAEQKIEQLQVNDEGELEASE